MAKQALGIGTGEIMQGAGLIYDMVTKRQQERRQHERQKDLQKHSNELQYDLWNKTNAEAQRKHYEKAGLNVGLMYEGGGASGTTGAGGAGTAPTAQSYELGANLAQMRATEAQTKLAEAQARKTDVEAENLAGIERTESESRTGLNEVTTRIKEIEARVSGKTEEEQINMIRDGADKMLAETVQQQHNQIISEETYRDKINEIKEQSIGSILANQATRQGIKLDEARTRQIAEQILQEWEKVRLQGDNIEASIENTRKMAESILWGAGIQAGGNIVNSVIGIATKQPQKGSVTDITKEYEDGYSRERRVQRNLK